MNWQPSLLWTRWQSAGLVMFLVVVGCGVAVLFVPLLRQNHALRAELLRVDQEIAAQESLEKQQQAEIELLKTDALYVERVARGKLNLCRPNEVIFRFEPVPKASPQPVPPR